jgi:hypothetical protein
VANFQEVSRYLWASRAPDGIEESVLSYHEKPDGRGMWRHEASTDTTINFTSSTGGVRKFETEAAAGGVQYVRALATLYGISAEKQGEFGLVL